MSKHKLDSSLINFDVAFSIYKKNAKQNSFSHDISARDKYCLSTHSYIAYTYKTAWGLLQHRYKIIYIRRSKDFWYTPYYKMGKIIT